MASTSGTRRPLVDVLRVSCPRRNGDLVDLSRCLGCNWLDQLDRTADVPWLDCAAGHLEDVAVTRERVD